MASGGSPRRRIPPLVLRAHIVAASLDQFVFLVPAGHRYTIDAIYYNGSVVGSDGGTVSAIVRKITDTTSLPGAAAGATVVELMSAVFDLKTACPCALVAAMVAIATRRITGGQKLAIDLIGTLTGVVGDIEIHLRKE